MLRQLGKITNHDIECARKENAFIVIFLTSDYCYLLKADHGLAPNTDNVIGIISLIFWALMIVVSLKYITLILRADSTIRYARMCCQIRCAVIIVSSKYCRRAALYFGRIGDDSATASPCRSKKRMLRGMAIFSESCH